MPATATRRKRARSTRPTIDPFAERFENAKRVIEAHHHLARNGIQPLTRSERAQMAEMLCRWIAEEFPDTDREKYPWVEITLWDVTGDDSRGGCARIDMETGEVV